MTVLYCFRQTSNAKWKIFSQNQYYAAQYAMVEFMKIALLTISYAKDFKNFCEKKLNNLDSKGTERSLKSVKIRATNLF